MMNYNYYHLLPEEPSTEASGILDERSRSDLSVQHVFQKLETVVPSLVKRIKVVSDMT